MNRREPRKISAPERALRVLLAAVLFLAWPSGVGVNSARAQSAVPSLVNYQGRLTDALNNPLSGSHAFVFEIYDALTGGNQLWTETRPAVTVLNGVFAVQLGAATALPSSVFSAPDAYLRVTVDGTPLSPRERLITAPYAFNAQLLRGRELGAFVSTDTAQTVAGDKTFTGALSVPAPTLAGHAATKGYVDAQVGGATGWTDDGAVIRLTTLTDNVVIASTLTVQGNAFSVGTSTFVVAAGRVGVGTANPAAALDVNGVSRFLGNALFSSDVTGDNGANFDLRLRPGSASGAVRVYDAASAAELLRVTNAGSVGVGTPAPAARLDVAGDAQFGAGATKSTFSATGALTFPSGYAPAAALDAATKGYVDAQVGAGSGWTDDGAVVRLTASGDNVVVASTLTVQGNAFSVGGSTLVATIGRVGIGTASPTDPLHVRGDAPSVKLEHTGGADLQLHTSDGSGLAGIRITEGTNKLSIQDAGDTVLARASGSVGIRTVDPAQALDVNGDAQFGFGAAKSTFSATGGLSLAGNAGLTLTGPTAYFTSGSSVTASAFFGDGSNLTGINAADKVAKAGDFMSGQLTTESTITVKGNAFSVGGSTFVVTGSSVGIGTAAPTRQLTVRGDSGLEVLDGAGSTIMTVRPSSGRVGFFTPNPNSPLEIAGQTYVNGGGGNGSLVVTGGGSNNGFEINAFSAAAAGAALGTYSDTKLALRTNGADRLTVLNTGEIGIGTRAPAALLDVNGAAAFGAGATKSTFSATGRLTFPSGYSPAVPLEAASKGYVDSQLSSAGGWTDDGAVVRLTAPGDNVVVASTLTVQGDAFSVGGSTFVVSGSSIGIGTANPMQRLHVAGNVLLDKSGTASAGDTLKDSRELILRASAWNGSAAVDADWSIVNKALIASNPPTNRLDFIDRLNGVTVLSITGGNNGDRVGIGLGGASPSDTFHVGGKSLFGETVSLFYDDPSLILRDTVPSDVRWGLRNGNDTFSIDAVSNTGAVERMVLAAARSGAVGIGASAPSARLHVSSAGAMPADTLLLVSSGSAAGQELLVVKGDGKVGIGTAAPARRLEVAAGGADTAYLRVSGGDGGGGARMELKKGTAGNDQLVDFLNWNGSWMGSIGMNPSGHFVFYDSSFNVPFFVNMNTRHVGVNDTTAYSTMTVGGAVGFTGIGQPATGPGAGRGVLYFDSAAGKFRVSENGGAFADLVGGASAAGWTDDGAVVRLTTPGDNVVVASTLTVQGDAFSVGGSTFAVKSGLVGIGVAAPSVPLHVSGASSQIKLDDYEGGNAAAITLNDADAATSEIMNLNWSRQDATMATIFLSAVNDMALQTEPASGKTIRFKPGGSEAARIAGGGQVGIGTSAPSYRLHVASGAGSTETIFAVSTGTSDIFRVTGAGDVFANRFTGDGSGLVNVSGNDSSKVSKAGDFMSGQLTIAGSSLTVRSNAASSPLLVSTSATPGTAGLYVDGTNKVGIGTAYPAAKLHVSSGTLLVDGDASTALQVGFSTFVVKSEGRVGIGTPSPAAALEVVGEVRSQFIGDTADPSVFLDLANTNISMMANGKVGLGTSPAAPSALLHVSSANAAATADLLLVSSGTAAGQDLFRVTGDGRVTIGASSSANSLTITRKPDALRSHLQLGDFSATAGTASSKLSFAGWGIEHAGFAWVPDGTLSNGKLHLSFGGTDDPDSNTKRVTFQANGNVGIGTTNPKSALDLSAGVLTFGSAASSSTIHQDLVTDDLVVAINREATDSDIVFRVQKSTEVLRVTGGGNVAIGTASPFTWLPGTIRRSLQADGWIVARGNGSSSWGDLAGRVGVSSSTSGGEVWYFSANSDGKMAVHQGGLGDRLTIDQSGNVGVGVTPTAKLHVGGTAGVDGIRFPDGTLMTTAGVGSASNLANAIDVVVNADSDANGSGAVRLQTAATDRLTIVNGGAVGVGTTDPSEGGAVNSKLTIRQADAFTGLAVMSAAGGRRFALNPIAGGGWTLYDGAAGGSWTAGISQSSGNAGVGTSSPDFKLEVTGAGASSASVITVNRNFFFQDGGSGTGHLANNAYYVSGWNIADASKRASTIEMRNFNDANFGNIDMYVTQTVGAIDWKRMLSITTAAVSLADGGGFVGIGKTTPAAHLDIDPADGTTTWIRLGGEAATASKYVGLESGGTGFGANSGFSGVEFGAPAGAGEGYLAFHTHDVAVQSGEKMRIDKSGNVGVGTPTPGQKLDVVGTVRGSTLTATQNIVLPDAATNASGNLFFGGDTSSTRSGLRLFGGLVNGGSTEGGFIDAVSTSATGGLIIRVDSTTGATERMRVTTAGNVGVGISSPTSRLHVHDGDIRVSTSPGQGSRGIVFQDGTVQLTASGASQWAASADDVYATNAGQVGIGIAAPTNSLHVYDRSGAAGRANILIEASAENAYLNMQADAWTANPIATLVKQGSTGLLKFNNAGSSAVDHLVVDGQGRVGAGAVPAARLHVSSANAVSTDQVFLVSSGTAAGQELLTVTGDGKVGIGTTTMNRRLHVHSTNGLGMLLRNDGPGNSVLEIQSMQNAQRAVNFLDSSGSAASQIATYGTAAGSSMTFRTSGTEQMKIDENGKVGVGTPSPETKLDVNGDAQFGSGATKSTFSATGALTFPSGYTPGSALQAATKGYVDSQVTGGSGWTDAGAVVQLVTPTDSIGSAGAGVTVSTHLIVSAGNVGIGTTGPGHALQFGTHFNGAVANAKVFIDAGGYNAWNGKVAISPDGNAAVASVISAYHDNTLNVQKLGLGTIGYSGVEQTMVLQDGKAGVGALHPAARLHVSSGTLLVDGSGGALHVKNGSGQGLARVQGSAAASVFLQDDAGGGVTYQLDSGAEAAGKFTITHSGVGRRLTIDSVGNVGVGTISPQAKLDVRGGIVGYGVSVSTDNVSRSALWLATYGDFNHALYNNFSNIDGEGGWDGAKLNVFNGLNVRIGPSRTSALYLNSSGHFGVGTAAPTARLHVSSESATSADSVLLVSSGAAAGQELLVVKGDGKLGLGTASPQAPLHLRGGNTALFVTAQSSGTSTAGSGGTARIQLTDYFDSRAVIEVVGAGANGPSDKGTGHGKDLYVKAGNSDNTALKTGGDLYLLPGVPNAPATVYGDVLIAKDGGNVGIGIAPTTKLHVNGAVTANGTGGNVPHACTNRSFNGVSNNAAITVTCSAGERVMGGGGNCDDGSFRASQPSGTTGWSLICSTSDGLGSNDTVHAVCCQY